MLEVVEYLDVAVVGRAEACQQVRQTVLVVVFVSKLKDRLAQQLAKPNHSGTNSLVVPLAIGDEPRVDDACQLAGGSQVADEFGIVVSLDVCSRDGICNFALDDFLHDVGLFFAPCGEEKLVC